MATKLITKPKLLSEFLDICRKNQYFAATVDNNVIKNIKYLDHASNLQKNIERQWLYKSKDIENSLKTYNNSEFSEYGENLSLLEKYAIVRKRDRLARTIPFGLIEGGDESSATVFNGCNSDDSSINIQLEKSSKSLTCSYLVNEKQSQEYFYRIQRLRKIWWMKYAANPGRFLISEVKQDEQNDTKSVSIKATFPFGTLDIESVHVEPLKLTESSPELKIKAAAPTKVIKTTTIPELAVIETVLDSIDAGDFGEMCLHRKIAPYQCTVLSLSKELSAPDDLRELSKYITLLLQRSQISVLSMENSHFSDETSLQQKYNEIDAIGVPYGLIVDIESLETGFMKLRNRETTLSETIHISYLNDYLPQIFQS